ncbi:MAG: hypothetical protein H6838_19725 [Planctomycetes bacterium]|nr:hypothetical protein [Planctomycetota bacterium]
MKPTTILWCAAAVAACAQAAHPSDQATQRLAEAQRTLATDPERSLRITDELLAAAPDWRQARLCAAEGSLRLARTGTSTRKDLLLSDAVRNYERGIEGEEPAANPTAWLQLAECHYELGEFVTAADVAGQAATAFLSAKPANETQAAEAQLLVGRSYYRQFTAARQDELDNKEPDHRGVVVPEKETTRLATGAITAFEAARRQRPGEATTQIALVYQWLGQSQAVIAEYERGIRTAPGEAAIHDAYIAWMDNIGQREAMVGAYGRFVRENPSVPVLRWHQGRALYGRADQLRAEGNFQGAIEGYEKARATFADYGAQMPRHKDSVGQWLALCELSIARTSVEIGDLAGAREHLFAADAASPLTAAEENGRPQLVDSFGQHYAGVAFAIHRATAEIATDPLRATLSFNEALLARHPDRWGWVYNNAALAARDLGVQVAKDGKEQEATQLWERSYALYQKAVVLSPDDARIVNDCGLMLIYHLHRDYGRARELFEQAIAVGQKQLDALPADTDQKERELLEEAVGDAWQNIAVLLRDHEHRPFADYREFCERAVKFYPYQRREAAGMLRDGAAQHAPNTADAAAQGGAADAFAKAQKAAKAKADSGDLDGALGELDGVAKECAKYAPYQAYRGDLNLQLAKQARDAGRKGVEFLFADAVNALKKAVELDSDPVAPRRMLAEAQYESGDLAAAAQTASQLLLHMQSQGGGKPDEVAAVHLIRANAAARAYAAKKGDGGDDADMLTAARASFRVLEQQDRLDAALRSLWSVTEQWAGAPAEAVNVYVRALAKNPDDQALLASVVDTAAAQSQLALAVDALKDRSDATGLWYLGRARYLLADSERQSGSSDKAQALLDQARSAFTDSMGKNAGYRDSCEQWVAMCLGKKGNIAFFAKDLDNAEKWLLEAARMRPDRIGEDLGLSETTKLGILRVADSYFKARDLGKTEALYRAASDIATGDLDLLNNAGLFARDWGNQLERSGKQKEAMEMYEQSYKAYRRAQQLDPANVRLRNDCALIAIYHLDRDWDLSKSLLDAAIADGTKLLESNPPADRNDRQNLEEAVGDCYENLALWHLKHSKDGAAAKAAAEASQKFYPGARRPGARRHLQEAERLLQGK